LDLYLQNGRIPQANIVAKTQDKSKNLKMKEALLTELGSVEIGEVLELCGVHDANDEMLVRDLGVEMLVTLFCECDVYISKVFRDELKEFGIGAATAMKLFMFFNKVAKSEVHEK
jgi:hypothetical protein